MSTVSTVVVNTCKHLMSYFFAVIASQKFYHLLGVVELWNLNQISIELNLGRINLIAAKQLQSQMKVLFSSSMFHMPEHRSNFHNFS